jgi:hypothetical protein
MVNCFQNKTKLIEVLLILLIVPTWILLDTLVAFLRGWRTNSRLDWIVIGLAMPVVIGITAVAVFGSRFRWLRRGLTHWGELGAAQFFVRP